VLSAPGRRRTAACRTAALGATAAVLACLAVAGGAAPARADSVRVREQWVLDAINAPAAWNSSQGQGVTVAVIDSGVEPDVPDLAGSVTTGPDLTGVGTPPGNPYWGQHGTWMASLIAGHGHDGGGSGIIGVAPQARILSIRVITDKNDPGYPAYHRQSPGRGQQELAAGITDAVRAHASVISMSLGYGGPSRAVRVALQDAFAHNVVVVASSGNSGDAAGADGKGSAPYSFPADYPGVLGVGAVFPSGQPAPFSSENLSVQVAAPGVNVPAEGRDSQYWLVSGTSPACAITAGVAALIKSKYPGLSDAQVSDAITGSTWRRPSGGYDQQVGFGTVDAAAALALAGRLAAVRTGSPGQAVSASSHFGGPAAAPAPPLAPRGPLALVAYCLLGVACLAAVAVAALRLVARTAPRTAYPGASTLPGGYPAGNAGLPGSTTAYPPGSGSGYGSGYRPDDGNGRGRAYPPDSGNGRGSAYPPDSGYGYGPDSGNGSGYRPRDGHGSGVGYGPDSGYRSSNGGPTAPAGQPPRDDRPDARPPGAGPFPAGRPGSRRHDSGPGAGPSPGAIRFPRSSRSPGRHAAPPEPPADRGDAR
jgi:Subtilase family